VLPLMRPSDILRGKPNKNKSQNYTKIKLEAETDDGRVNGRLARPPVHKPGQKEQTRATNFGVLT
jgi:hypothetical protein